MLFGDTDRDEPAPEGCLQALAWNAVCVAIPLVVASAGVKLLPHHVCGFWEKVAWWIGIFSACFAATAALRYFRRSRSYGRSVLIGLVAGLAAAFVLQILCATNFGAISRGRQKRTMANIRSIATTIESLHVGDSYPVLDSVRKLNELSNETLPENDSWGTPLLVRTVPDRYVVVSRGECGVAERTDPWTYPERKTTDYKADIVYRDGRFVQWPEGVQK